MGAFCGKFKDEHESTEESTISEKGEEEDEDEKELVQKTTNFKTMFKKKKTKKKKKPDKKGAQAGQQAGMGGGKVQWAPYLSSIMVSVKSGAGGAGGEQKQEFLKLTAPPRKVKQLTPGMLGAISEIKQLDTLELCRCHLTTFPDRLFDLENLRVLTMSHNELDYVDPNLPKCVKLERLIMDWNMIKSIDPGIFSEDKFKTLVVLNFSHNRLAVLPVQFGSGLDQIKYIDVSYNKLVLIPDAILNCRRLQVMILSHNRLKQLPDNIDKLEDLRKLFVSFNQLHELPDKIGMCKHLQKIRVVSNSIRNMPWSIIRLWTAEGGSLEELLVDRNPLVHPSITAFEMGGLHQALKLFKEYVETEAFQGAAKAVKAAIADPKQEHLEMELRNFAQQSAKILNVLERFSWTKMAPEGGGDEEWQFQFWQMWQKDKKLEAKLKEILRELEANGGGQDGADVSPSKPAAQKQGDGAAPLPASDGAPSAAISLPAGGKEEPDLAISDQKATTAQKQADAGADAGAEKAAAPVEVDYYFSHCKDKEGKAMEDKIADIRSAESSLLLLKKTMFVESQKKVAKEKKEAGGEVPKHLKQFLEEGFDVTKYHAVVRVSDLDLYFNLLVFSTKPMLSTAHFLFDKFTSEKKTPEGHLYMDSAEWANFCTRVPVKLPDKIQGEMWKLMAWRNPKQIEERDFIAAWHIHDVEKRDPWIKRVAKVLKLDYYDMDVDEMQDRLSAKGAQDADPKLDFDDSDSDDGVAVMNEDGKRVMAEKEEKTETVLEMEMVEGERRFTAPAHAVVVHDAGTAAQPKADNYKVVVSFTEQEYSALQAQLLEQGGSDAEVSDVSLHSSRLSEESDDSDFSFEAELYMVRDDSDEEDVPAEGGDGKKVDKKPKRLVIDGDEALGTLMTLSPEDILQNDDKKKKKTDTGGGPADKDAGKKKKKKKAKPKQQINDPRYKTDIFSVRQVVRQVYRNLPHDDFVKLINFLLRGMRFMKHSPADRPSYWHGDEPTFKHTMGEAGQNPYTRLLLVKMGFVCINDLYWVWPALHLKPKKDSQDKKIATWGDKVIPPHCPGRDKDRMEDMILLFRNCQRAINKDGPTGAFHGHFK